MKTEITSVLGLGCRCGFMVIDHSLGSALQEFEEHSVSGCRRVSEWAAPDPLGAATIQQWRGDLKALNESLDLDDAEQEQLERNAEWAKASKRRMDYQLGTVERDLLEKYRVRMLGAIGVLIALVLWVTR